MTPSPEDIEIAHGITVEWQKETGWRDGTAELMKRIASALATQREQLTCADHSGMSCREGHLDDEMMINRLRNILATERDSFGKREIELMLKIKERDGLILEFISAVQSYVNGETYSAGYLGTLLAKAKKILDGKA